MITIKTWRDPYESGFSPTKPREITLEPGLTVLVGCNGAGKTTLLHNIEDAMKTQNIPCHLYDNLRDGGSSSIGEALFSKNHELGISLWCASEGEAIKINFGQASIKFERFLKEGFFDSRKNRMAEIFKDSDKGETKPEIGNKRVLLFDAVDSGLSVDSIVEVKGVLRIVLEQADRLGIELYIIISANEYELARNAECFDVNDGKYIKFTDYEEYRSFILKSRKRKETRIKKQDIWFEKKRQKAADARAKRKAKYEPKIAEIKSRAEKENRELTWHEKSKIQDYERIIEENEY